MGPSFRRTAYQQERTTTPVQHSDSWKQIPAWLKDASLALPDRTLTVVERLPCIMLLLDESDPTLGLRRILKPCPLQVLCLKSCREAA